MRLLFAEVIMPPHWNPAQDAQLTPVAPQLWLARMPISVLGFRMSACMTVVQLPDGGLWLHSPIALSTALAYILYFRILQAAGATNLLLVTLVEEALFRGYLQGGLSRWFKQLPYGQTLALVIASLLFGLAHIGAGWQWVVLAGIAGLCYGLAYRFGGLSAAIATHFGLNLLHFGLFTYPMLAG